MTEEANLLIQLTVARAALGDPPAQAVRSAKSYFHELYTLALCSLCRGRGTLEEEPEPTDRFAPPSIDCPECGGAGIDFRSRG